MPVSVAPDSPVVLSTRKSNPRGCVVKIASQYYSQLTRLQLDFIDKKRAQSEGPSFSSTYLPHQQSMLTNFIAKKRAEQAYDDNSANY